jgi:hypothetical protein
MILSNSTLFLSPDFGGTLIFLNDLAHKLHEVTKITSGE